MNNYFYPAIFTYNEEDKCYMVDFIDLKGCSTFGSTIDEAYLMAQDALGLYLSDLENFPKPTIPYNHIKLKNNQFISIIEIDLLEYRKKYPEASLKELSEIISIETGTPITKSGLNHRFRKIKELATRFKDLDKK